MRSHMGGSAEGGGLPVLCASEGLAGCCCVVLRKFPSCPTPPRLGPAPIPPRAVVRALCARAWGGGAEGGGLPVLCASAGLAGCCCVVLRMFPSCPTPPLPALAPRRSHPALWCVRCALARGVAVQRRWTCAVACCSGTPSCGSPPRKPEATRGSPSPWRPCSAPAPGSPCLGLDSSSGGAGAAGAGHVVGPGAPCAPESCVPCCMTAVQRAAGGGGHPVLRLSRHAYRGRATPRPCRGIREGRELPLPFSSLPAATGLCCERRLRWALQKVHPLRKSGGLSLAGKGTLMYTLHSKVAYNER